MSTTPYRNGRVHVCSEMCETCVFRPGNLMHLPSGRLRDLIDENLGGGSALTCHKTIYDDPDQNHAICRGFFDRFADTSLVLRLAQEMDIITLLDPPSRK